MALNAYILAGRLLVLGSVIHAERFVASAGRLEQNGVKKWILVRHGESVNNLLSQDAAVVQFLKEGGLKTWQDPFMSHKGEQQCLAAGRALFGENRTSDRYQILGEDAYGAVYVSPLRRTLKTALLIFGRAAHKTGVPFKAMPWAHEKRGSISDIGLGSRQLLKYARQEVEHDVEMHSGSNETTEPLKTLSETLEDLPNDWSTNPNVPDSDLPYYPANPGIGTKSESREFLVRRMAKLQSEMLEIPEQAAILVTHSGVIRTLLASFLAGQRPDNAAIIYGELSSEGWSDVKLFGDGAHGNEQIKGLAGFRNELVTCKSRSCDDYDEEFRTLGIAKKYARGTCCSRSSVRLWVYDTLLLALTYFKPNSDPKKDGGRATIHLQKTTSVWYTSHAKVTLKPADFANALPNNPYTSSFEMTLKAQQIQFRRATCDTCASQFLQAEKEDPMQTLIIYTPQAGAETYECKSDACFLKLTAEKYHKGDTEQNARRQLVKIAVAAACSHSEDADIDASLA
eukprot:CAMPEP_0172925986 /NCGR_PEP_ID=MMETSP1075-20121228/214760_1 /TAXON_ID=2916 /ORGANISM="Ceratium fusus, Strain PA161109" /LENGTH=511 /DNA_ID=CAMNT_0013786959 /DNA_START=22 /DNA_END=1553 /DNA_ORIENTATION=-